MAFASRPNRFFFLRVVSFSSFLLTLSWLRIVIFRAPFRVRNIPVRLLRQWIVPPIDQSTVRSYIFACSRSFIEAPSRRPARICAIIDAPPCTPIIPENKPSRINGKYNILINEFEFVVTKFIEQTINVGTVLTRTYEAFDQKMKLTSPLRGNVRVSERGKEKEEIG